MEYCLCDFFWGYCVVVLRFCFIVESLIGVLVLLAVLLREEEEEPIVVAIVEPPKNEYELITSTNKLVENLLICYYRSTLASFLLSRNRSYRYAYVKLIFNATLVICFVI